MWRFDRESILKCLGGVYFNKKGMEDQSMREDYIGQKCVCVGGGSSCVSVVYI